NEKEKKFIIIAIRHFGKKLENGNILWDEERQHVMIALNERYEDLVFFQRVALVLQANKLNLARETPSPPSVGFAFQHGSLG
ncbi:MAG: hypothetical protein LBP90_05600, partial [Burkholderiales bacterium]|nr:hypothetical protein [Burkholderiales bacterium]